MKRYLLFFAFFPCLLVHAQTGPGGVATSNGTSALKLWLDADRGIYRDMAQQQPTLQNDRLFLWQDLSGSNNNVWAATDSGRPTYISASPLFNGHATIRFSRDAGTGNRRNYLASSSFSKTEDITIYCVLHPLLKGGGNNVTPYTGTHPNNDTLWYSGAGIVDADVNNPKNDISLTLCDTSLAAGGGDSLLQKEFTVKTPASLHKTYFACLQKEAKSGLLQISKNGSISTSVVAGTQSITQSDHFTIGATSNTVYGDDLTFFDGYIAVVAIYNKKLTEAEKTIADNYFSTTYNIPLQQADIFLMDEPANGNYDWQLAGIGQGNDGIPMLAARGEGSVEIQAEKLENQSYLLWAHNNAPLHYQLTDLPEGVRQRLARTWRVSKTGTTGLVDVLFDADKLVLDSQDELVLLVDLDNNGSFQDQHPGNGMFSHSETPKGTVRHFKNVDFANGSRFTFAVLKQACMADCDEAFSPNGDGISDTYYIPSAGNTLIYNKLGEKIRELKTPGYWDGTNMENASVDPGLYFIVSSEARQKTVTLIK